MYFLTPSLACRCDGSDKLNSCMMVSGLWWSCICTVIGQQWSVLLLFKESDNQTGEMVLWLYIVTIVILCVECSSLVLYLGLVSLWSKVLDLDRGSGACINWIIGPSENEFVYRLIDCNVCHVKLACCRINGLRSITCCTVRKSKMRQGSTGTITNRHTSIIRVFEQRYSSKKFSKSIDSLRREQTILHSMAPMPS